MLEQELLKASAIVPVFTRAVAQQEPPPEIIPGCFRCEHGGRNLGQNNQYATITLTPRGLNAPISFVISMSDAWYRDAVRNNHFLAALRYLTGVSDGWTIRATDLQSVSARLQWFNGTLTHLENRTIHLQTLYAHLDPQAQIRMDVFVSRALGAYLEPAEFPLSLAENTPQEWLARLRATTIGRIDTVMSTLFMGYRGNNARYSNTLVRMTPPKTKTPRMSKIYNLGTPDRPIRAQITDLPPAEYLVGDDE